jgi:hypothetical protein
LLTGTNDVSLLFSGNAKLATTNTGVDITGTTVTDGLTSECAAGDSNLALTAYHPTGTSARNIAKFQSNVGSTQADVVTIGCDGGIEAVGEITTTNSLSQNSNSIRTAIGNDGGSATFGTSTNHQIKLFTNNTHVATLDASGRMLMPFQPVAAVSYSGSDISPTTVIPLNSGGFTRGAMTTSSDRITVPVAGAYFVGFHHLGATGGAQIQIRVNGAAVAGGQTQEASGGNDNVSAQDILNLSANDYIEFAVVSSGSIHGNANFNRMYAYLIG